jgi:hypothetical protein
MALPPHLYVKRNGVYVTSAANLESWPPYVGPPLWAHRLQRFYDIVTTDMTSAERAGLAEKFMRSTAGKRTQCCRGFRQFASSAPWLHAVGVWWLS